MTIRKTGELVPEFGFELVNGGHWNSRDIVPGSFTLLTVYRGKWCPHCKNQLTELDQLNGDFAERGVATLAVSADTRVRAESTITELGLDRLTMGYEIPIDRARDLGLFISSQVKDEEMPLFCEPGSFLIDADSRVFAAWIASNAFARTAPRDILAYVDFISEKKGRPPRGSA
ncbi:redoxin domain-containing protein [Pseudomaricurvus alkylphenolicus]|uniref:redoxin domain-containing protein n=1 Tax=Pseudomaricurvus alkylphenolicus TaxID=1306991 RepID=UPI0014216D12|nr:redoxin domain-containing protein [Pseudomaricurvus alkylphenolicus]NIB38525.1 redoxin domain-containing protein [Pseudomaricurvus alkylphenolicus]